MPFVNLYLGMLGGTVAQSIQACCDSPPPSAPRLLHLHQHQHLCHSAMALLREAGWLETNPLKNTTKQIAVGNQRGEGEGCLGFAG